MIDLDTITKFVQFWEKYDQDRLADRTAIKRDPSPGKMAQAYTATLTDLESSRALTLKYLQPVKTPKGLWAVGFSNTNVDQIADLHSTITKQEDRLESIGHSIQAFLELTGGRADLEAMLTELDQTSAKISRANQKAAASKKILIRRDRSITSEALSQDPTVQATDLFVKQLKEELMPVIAALNKRLQDAAEICNRYVDKQDPEPPRVFSTQTVPGPVYDANVMKPAEAAETPIEPQEVV